MFELIILNADGSSYCNEYFNDNASATAWITEEQTRPYWNPTNTYTIVDNTPAPIVPTPLEICYKNRIAAYPPATDYLDGIVKSDIAQQQVYIAACLAVKALYPKPTT